MLGPVHRLPRGSLPIGAVLLLKPSKAARSRRAPSLRLAPLARVAALVRARRRGCTRAASRCSSGVVLAAVLPARSAPTKLSAPEDLVARACEGWRCSSSSMETKITPSSVSRFRASLSRGYIMLSQSEWNRPLDSVFATSAVACVVDLAGALAGTRRSSRRSRPRRRSRCPCCRAGRCRSA